MPHVGLGCIHTGFQLGSAIAQLVRTVVPKLNRLRRPLSPLRANPEGVRRWARHIEIAVGFAQLAERWPSRSPLEDRPPEWQVAALAGSVRSIGCHGMKIGTMRTIQARRDVTRHAGDGSARCLPPRFRLDGWESERITLALHEAIVRIGGAQYHVWHRTG